MLDDTVNIIVIGYNLKETEANCLDSIVRFTQFPYLLTFYDNSKNEYTLTEIWNKLIAESPSNIICLLNNDTKVHYAWLGKLVHPLVHLPDCGFIGPSTNNCHGPQCSIGSQAEAAKHANDIVKMKDPISGFCLLFKKSTWEHLNGFDERYTLYGQESDLIDRARTELGLHCYWRKDTFIWHQGEASVKKAGIDVDTEREHAKKIYWSTRKK
jgi:GT2 family glycosyltransferase